MPQLQNIVIADGAATPVNHTYKPTGIESGVAFFYEDSASLIGRNALSVGRRAPTGNAVTHKVTARLSDPKVVQTTGSNGVSQDTVINTRLSTAEFVFAKDSTKQERKDMRVKMANFLLSSYAESVIDDAEGQW